MNEVPGEARGRSRRLLPGAGSAALAAIAVVACVAVWVSAASSSVGARASVLRIAQVESGVSETWDPALFNDNRTIEIAQNQFGGLLDINEQLKVVPNLAQSWSVSKNGRVFTFKLRRNVRFQNGDPVTASDFVYTFTRSLLPKTASDTSFFLEDIAGADAVLSGKAKKLSGVKAVDPYTLRVTLTHAAGYFPNLVSRWPAWVVDSKVVDKLGTSWVKPGNSIGTGAYRLTGKVGDQEFDFTANPNYWGHKGSIARVQWHAIPDSTAALARYQSGDFDVVLNVSAASVLKVKSDPALRAQFHSRPLLRTVWLSWDNKKAPFNKRLVRLAFSHAIDKAALVRVALSGQGQAAYGWLPPGLPGSIGTGKKTFDPKLAKQLLSQAGYPNGNGFPKVDLAFTESLGQQQQVFEFVQGQLQQNLGVKVGLKSVPSNAFDGMVKNPKTRPGLWGYTFGFDYPDAQEADQYLRVTGAPYNYEDYSNKTYDKLVARANAGSNQATRSKLYRQADQVLVNDAGIVPLYYPLTNWLAKPYVKNFAQTALYMRTWDKMSLRP